MAVKQAIVGKRAASGFVRIAAELILTAICLLLLVLPAEDRDLLFVAGLALLGVVAYQHFPSAWILIIALLPLLNLFGAMFDQPKITGIRILLVVLLPIFIVKVKPDRFWQQIRGPWAIKGFLLFILANLLSAVRWSSIEAVFRSLTYFEPLLFYVFTYYVVRRNTGNFRLIMRAIVFGGIVVGLIGLLELLSQSSFLNLFGITDARINALYLSDVYLTDNRLGLGGRISSTLMQPVYAAIFFAICLAITIFYRIVYAPRNKLLLFVLVPIGSVLILATGSRGPLLSIVFAVVCTSLLIGRGKTRIISAGLTIILLVTVILVLPTQARSFLVDSLDPNQSVSANVFGRFNLTASLFEIFSASPIVGVGPGLIQKLGFEGDPEFAELVGLENQYAVILADAGLIAGAAYLIFMGGVFGLLWKIRKNSRDREVRYGDLVLITIFVFYFVAAASATIVTGLSNQTIMIAFGAVVALNDNREDPSSRDL
jgi:O-antigen ligase